MQPVPKPLFTPRQRRIIGLACEGLTNKEIGRRIGISEASVKQEVRRIYKQLGVTRRAELMLYLTRNLAKR